MVWTVKNEGMTILQRIAYYGLFWFLYGTPPKHAAPSRAKWSRYFYFRETKPYSRRKGRTLISAAYLVAELQRERRVWGPKPRIT